MDIQKFYGHFRLGPSMRDWCIYYYDGKFYQCVKLLFGWGRSPPWFTQLMVLFVREFRRRQLPVLAYLEDFVMAFSPLGTVESKADCDRARPLVERLLLQPVFTLQQEKLEW